MTGAVGRDGAYLAERVRLINLAYRMLGSMADAEDIVQDVGLKWLHADWSSIDNAAAWLTTVTTRASIDRLRSAQHQREHYVGPWLPEPVVNGPWSPSTSNAADPADTIDLAESMTLGFLVMLERLNPIERAVFLLAEVFDEPFSRVASIVGRSEPNCRQIAHRARQKVRSGAPRFQPDPAAGMRALEAFLVAAVSGDVDGLLAILAPDVEFVSDGGADHHAARRPVQGADRTSRFVINLAKRLLGSHVAVQVAWINGEPGFVGFLDDQPVLVQSIEVRDGHIVRLRAIVNQSKLHGLRKVDAD